MFDSIWKQTMRTLCTSTAPTQAKLLDEILHAGLELYSKVRKYTNRCLTSCLVWSQTQRKLRLQMILIQQHLWRGVCHYILSAKRNTRTFRGWRHLESIARRRLYLPESRIESTNVHSKMPTLSTDESDQTFKVKRFTAAELYPFQVICADHICPLPKDEEGYQHILVVICAFSRWIELFPTKTTTAEETARCIHQHYGRWGTADRIRTDNGPAFVNDLLKGVANLLRSTNEFTTAYSSEENDIVEWANKEVLRNLRIKHELRINDLSKIYL